MIEIEKGKAAPVIVLVQKMIDEIMRSLTARIGCESVERIEGLRVWIVSRRRRRLLVPSKDENVLAKVEHLLFDRPEDRLLCDLEDGLVRGRRDFRSLDEEKLLLLKAMDELRQGRREHGLHGARGLLVRKVGRHPGRRGRGRGPESRNADGQ